MPVYCLQPVLSLPFRLALGGLYLAAFVVVCSLAADGASYYATPLVERARHADYWRLKPGGSTGHALGITGSSMMLLMLGYSVRKRVGALRRLGPLARWLDVHILLGVVGPALVVLHSSFKVQGLVALSFWSMVVVALSGVLGRYLYLQIPRTKAGEALSLAELQARDRELHARLRALGLDAARLARLDALAAPPPSRGLLRSLVALWLDDLREAARVAAFARECAADVPADLLGEVREVAREAARTHRRLAVWDRVHELFHWWHVVHKPFAVVMYLFMAVHVGVAAMTGYAGFGW